MSWIRRRRRLTNAVVLVASVFATAFALFWLTWILWTTLKFGFSALNKSLFTEMTPPPGEAGGLLNAFYGSFVTVAIGVAFGTPVGILAGTYLAEFGRGSRIAAVVRFVNDILLSAPSVVIGLFVYELMVRPVGHFSGLAGGVALAIIILPVIVRTTDEMLKLVPTSMREAAYSLGLPQWKVTTHLVYRAASSGILTGVLLGTARISGETAPLLFTSLNNQYWTTSPLEPMANVPVSIFQYAMSPYDDWHALAWAGALVLTMFVLLLGIVSRTFLAKRTQIA